MQVETLLPLSRVRVVALDELVLRAENEGDRHILAAIHEELTKHRFPGLRIMLADAAEKIASQEGGSGADQDR